LAVRLGFLSAKLKLEPQQLVAMNVKEARA